MKMAVKKYAVTVMTFAYLICIVDARYFAAGQNNLPDVIKTTNQAANKGSTSPNTTKNNSGKTQTQTSTSSNTMSGAGSGTRGSNVGRNDNTTTKREKTSRQPAQSATKNDSHKSPKQK